MACAITHWKYPSDPRWVVLLLAQTASTSRDHRMLWSVLARLLEPLLYTDAHMHRSIHAPRNICICMRVYTYTFVFLYMCVYVFVYTYVYV